MEVSLQGQKDRFEGGKVPRKEVGGSIKATKTVNERWCWDVFRSLKKEVLQLSKENKYVSSKGPRGYARDWKGNKPSKV